MTRYFSDIREGRDLCPDDEGLELKDVRSAKMEAAAALGGVAREAKRLVSRLVASHPGKLRPGQRSCSARPCSPA
ncbi:DUF6894 family protein [Bradyrhizobium tropiciagri]|uniref:DUF6894 family protein n=1 Tax=Bradyrhizobium tropiciagri TaxID=312253 RepID=UPI003D9B428C